VVEEQPEGLILERIVRTITVRVIENKGESLRELYDRLNQVCGEIDHLEGARERMVWMEEVRPRVEESITEIEQHFGIANGNLTGTGITGDYHRVMLSLLQGFDRCMGATAVAEEWGGINTGNVSRVFRASRKSTEIYKGHFEKCKNGGYRFTSEGLEHALENGVPEILGDQSDDD
jgi:hypothetical protein